MSPLNLSKNKKVKAPKALKAKAAKAKKGDQSSQLAPLKSGKKQRAPKNQTKTSAVKVPANVYTLILLVAWLAITAACVLLFLDINSYK